ncbi:MAG: polyprenyl synthetase family protein [Corynebacterium sp.]|uniref:polyprenyl synthetase family protein n=1 Tax=Corynebacterium sp. TaxID=1720 RepID=UPI0026DBC63E|nr:polyprenyl synthetase family protein [Corynebacterium sp.]MDO5098987.1 polyprenyl synthetase family protein [Corynebacterium sp.]
MSNRAELRQNTGDSAIGTRVDLGDEALNDQVLSGMSRVETLLRDELSKSADFLSEKVMHLTAAGGKRFRPMFALLASNYGPNPMCDDVIKAAVIIEMTHLATLYHDDVMDEAEMRRGVPSANARWDNSVAILAGDILLAHASRIMSELGVETVAHFADTFGELVTGQMRETIGPGETDPITHYMKVIDEKTGVLIASAGYLGSMHSGATEEIRTALRDFGAAIGMVFQIVDDIIDIFSESTDSGKTPGTDLREGVFTLPVLYALQEDSSVGERLRAILTGPLDDDAIVAEVLDLLAQSTGRDKALADVRHYLSIAEASLAKLPENPTTQALRALAQFTVARVG